MTWKWSYSRLFKYDSCPHAYYFRYVLGMQEKETEAMAIGKQFHDVIASSVLRQPPPVGIPKDVQELAIKAYRLLQTHIFKGEIVAVEREIITPITETDLFHVVIDLIVQYDMFSLTVYDWKTSWAVYEVMQKPKQLFLYAWSAWQSGLYASEVAYLFPRKNEIKTAQVTPEAIAETLNWAKTQIHQARRAYQELKKGTPPEIAFPPKLGSGCTNCSFIRECPMTKKYQVH
ncbi:PD-(D/E)XK nuclease family protein [Brevibacillus thermoruber]|uniref:PD-(D/E)XK nuclease family protein n=1 Tax=Brevibacillus thermoruber TaxID=33942 RepID=A0A9X3TTD1_9BACL|nr:PD-(D/E)XK nuclease family protein [Brevibacillus thermoruber]MDA5110721.1 PD-(D/E)XK nuclease family protein [Brevibacillus thermoruber]